MTIGTHKGRELYMGATTDEIIALFKEKPHIELKPKPFSHQLMGEELGRLSTQE